jgi:uncharacterized YigZ family protein
MNLFFLWYRSTFRNMSNANIYSTISEPSDGIYKEKGSKFLSFAYPVFNTGQVHEILTSLKKEHPKAKHYCYAYLIRNRQDTIKTSDDGEPTNTAGKPILGQIVFFGLINILIVVVRYFGGTLLGKGGLIRAYKNASADALNHANIIQVIPKEIYQIIADYKNISEILKIIGENNCEIISSNYKENVVIRIKTDAGRSADIVGKFKRVEGINVERLEQRA